MALHDGEFLVAIDCKGTRDCWSERDHPAFSGRKFFLDLQPRARIVDDDIVWHHPPHALECQFNWFPGGDDKVEGVNT